MKLSFSFVEKKNLVIFKNDVNVTRLDHKWYKTIRSNYNYFFFCTGALLSIIILIYCLVKKLPNSVKNWDRKLIKSINKKRLNLVRVIKRKIDNCGVMLKRSIMKNLFN